MKTHVWRIGAGLVAVLLCVWALVFYFARYELTYGEDGVTVSCYSAAKVGGVGGAHLDYETDSAVSRGYTYSVIRGESAMEKLGQEADTTASRAHIGDRIEYWCDRVRTTRVASMTLLLAPAAVLASVAILWPRRRSSAG